jgi:hypothetical protein
MRDPFGPRGQPHLLEWPLIYSNPAGPAKLMPFEAARVMTVGSRTHPLPPIE